MEDMEKISVVIPIYNAEKTICNCINSLLNQSYKNLEIILVNDGSTDSSLLICKEYISKDDRIVLINQDNSGVSEARNNGIKVATGCYLAFVDPDDHIEYNMYDKLITSFKSIKSDIVFTNYRIIQNNQKRDTYIKGDSIVNIISKLLNGEMMGSVWRSLFVTKKIIQNGLWFDKNIDINEDLLFILEYCLLSNKVSVVDEVLYNYVLSENSTTKKYEQETIIKYNNELVFKKIEILLNNYDVYNKYSKDLNARKLVNVFGLLYNSILNTDNKENLSTKFIKKTLDESITVLKKNEYNYSNIDLKTRILYESIINKRIFRIYIYFSYLNYKNKRGRKHE